MISTEPQRIPATRNRSNRDREDSGSGNPQPAPHPGGAKENAIAGPHPPARNSGATAKLRAERSGGRAKELQSASSQHLASAGKAAAAQQREAAEKRGSV